MGPPFGQWNNAKNVKICVLRLKWSTYIEKASATCQARRHGRAFRGRAPRMTACAPQTKILLPKRGLCPEEINKLEATGVQIEAPDSRNSGYRPRIRKQEQFFHNFCGLTPDFIKLRVNFGTKTFFLNFFGHHFRIRGKLQDF